MLTGRKENDREVIADVSSFFLLQCSLQRNNTQTKMGANEGKKNMDKKKQVQYVSYKETVPTMLKPRCYVLMRMVTPASMCNMFQQVLTAL
jgi:hypothetical protein